jgi:hypothetical protein
VRGESDDGAGGVMSVGDLGTVAGQGRGGSMEVRVAGWGLKAVVVGWGARCSGGEESGSPAPSSGSRRAAGSVAATASRSRP